VKSKLNRSLKQKWNTAIENNFRSTVQQNKRKNTILLFLIYHSSKTEHLHFCMSIQSNLKWFATITWLSDNQPSFDRSRSSSPSHKITFIRFPTFARGNIRKLRQKDIFLANQVLIFLWMATEQCYLPMFIVQRFGI